MKTNYITIDGVIGAGKTTLTKMLTERYNARILLEIVEENPFLADFYRDRKRYAFQTQLFFLLSRYRQQQQIVQQDLFQGSLVSDYLFAKDKIFAYLNLEDRELALYEKIIVLLERDIVKPDLVVYLKSSPDRLMENIRKRGRDFERDMSESYIKALNDAYNHFFNRYTETDLLTINATEIDFVNVSGDFESIVDKIEAVLQW
ncbi:MAG: deoxynucleoside kinase [candidate division KSB1 bacterium]|nr:deoxynucleoside kinase [candidate division KSB1 bacterium]